MNYLHKSFIYLFLKLWNHTGDVVNGVVFVPYALKENSLLF